MIKFINSFGILLIGLLLINLFTFFFTPFIPNNNYPLVFSYLFIFILIFWLSNYLLIKFFFINLSFNFLFKFFSNIFSNIKFHLILISISIIGIFFHCYSKYYLYDFYGYTCIYEIREIWVNHYSHDLPNHIRVFSVLGHLLTSFIYFGVFSTNFIYFSTTKHNIIFLFLNIIYLAIAIIYAAFIGSKNIMFALVLIMLSAYLFSSLTLRYSKSKFIFSFLKISLIFIIFSSFFFGYAFQCNHKNFKNYNYTEIFSVKDSVWLEKQLSNNYSSYNLKDVNSNETVKKLFFEKCARCGQFLLYYNHGVYNFQSIIDTDQRGEKILLAFFKNLPSRISFGLIKESNVALESPEERPYGRGGLPLAAAAYYDYGHFGFLMLPIIFSFLLFFSLFLLTKENRLMKYFGLIGFVGILYIFLISNVFVGMSVISFPFIIFSFFLSFLLYEFFIRIKIIKIK